MHAERFLKVVLEDGSVHEVEVSTFPHQDSWSSPPVLVVDGTARSEGGGVASGVDRRSWPLSQVVSLDLVPAGASAEGGGESV